MRLPAPNAIIGGTIIGIVIVCVHLSRAGFVFGDGKPDAWPGDLVVTVAAAPNIYADKPDVRVYQLLDSMNGMWARAFAAAGAAMVFVAVATELTATLLLAPTGTRTLSMLFWSFSSELDYAAAAPYARVLVVLAIPVTLVLFRQSAKAAAL